MVHKIKVDKDKIIDVYASNWHYPLSDFGRFNRYLKKNFGFTTTKEHLRKVLGY